MHEKRAKKEYKTNYKKIKKEVDIYRVLMYNTICVKRVPQKTQKVNKAGCGSAWLERLVWDQEVAGSNPVTPIVCGCSSMVEH